MKVEPEPYKQRNQKEQTVGQAILHHGGFEIENIVRRQLFPREIQVSTILL